MKNFDVARNTLNTALFDSEGSAERELENYQKGIEYSLTKMKATFQELSTTVMSSNLFKGVIDGGTAFLDVLNDIISVGGGLPLIFGGIGGYQFLSNLD